MFAQFFLSVAIVKSILSVAIVKSDKTFVKIVFQFFFLEFEVEIIHRSLNNEKTTEYERYKQQ